MCVTWELNPQPFALLTQCSTTEPQEHDSFIIYETSKCTKKNLIKTVIERDLITSVNEVTSSNFRDANASWVKKVTRNRIRGRSVLLDKQNFSSNCQWIM